MMDFPNGPGAIGLVAGAKFSTRTDEVIPGLNVYFACSAAGSVASRQYASGRSSHAVPRRSEKGYHIALTSSSRLLEIAVFDRIIRDFREYHGSNGDPAPYTQALHSSGYATRPGGFWARSFSPSGSSRPSRLFRCARHRSTGELYQIAASSRVGADRNSRSLSIMWKTTFVPLHQGVKKYSRERRY